MKIMTVGVKKQLPVIVFFGSIIISAALILNITIVETSRLFTKASSYNADDIMDSYMDDNTNIDSNPAMADGGDETDTLEYNISQDDVAALVAKVIPGLLPMENPGIVFTAAGTVEMSGDIMIEGFLDFLTTQEIEVSQIARAAASLLPETVPFNIVMKPAVTEEAGGISAEIIAASLDGMAIPDQGLSDELTTRACDTLNAALRELNIPFRELEVTEGSLRLCF